MLDAQRSRANLLDRLVNADVRLPALLDSTDTAGGCSVPTGTGTGAGGVVYGATRVQLDPVHAQRIIGVNGEGDQGLVALAACQAYAREVAH